VRGFPLVPGFRLKARSELARHTRNMTELTREEVDATAGELVLEFGADWCPICDAARPLVDRVFADNSGVRRVWVEDGKGKPLGRSFGVKLWPTLVFLRDGREVARVVRPRGEAELRAAFESLSSADSRPILPGS
jgi:thioredoxin 1